MPNYPSIYLELQEIWKNLKSLTELNATDINDLVALDGRVDVLEQKTTAISYDSQKTYIEYSLENGHDTIASGEDSHAEGTETVASGDRSHAEGFQTCAVEDQSHAEGFGTHASGSSSHAEGIATRAEEAGSHSEGMHTRALYPVSHAEGYYTTASAFGSHAEGVYTNASGAISHAEGSYTKTIGQSSHAEGHFTTASSDYSHAEGYYTITSASYQHVQGKYNQTSSTALMLVGNGTGPESANRKNILEIYDSSVVVSGTLKVVGQVQDTLNITGSTYVTGNIKFKDGYGIDFGNVTGSKGTITSTVFKDYEEGTWTPTINGFTTSSHSASYIKIGRTINAHVIINGTGVNLNSTISLPYTSSITVPVVFVECTSTRTMFDHGILFSGSSYISSSNIGNHTFSAIVTYFNSNNN